MISAGLVIAFAGGASLGALYFLALWYATRHLAQGGPIWLFVLGTVGRFLMVIGALVWFLAVADATLADLGAAVIGFLAARFAATRLAPAGPQER